MKFCGVIGFVESKEIAPGVWEDEATERTYFGEVTRNYQKWDSNSEKLNDDININNSISIVADDYADVHLQNMRYIYWKGVYWSINTIEVNRPRLVLSIGGVYNGPTAAITGNSGGAFRF